jgi:hypothetical protein
VSLPINIKWSEAATATRRQPAAWVQTLNAQQQNMTHTALSAGSTDGSGWWGLLIMLMAWSVPSYIALQIYMLLKYEGRWRKLALLPLWLMIPLFAYTLFALLAGSNLWPLIMLFLTPLAFVYLLIIWGLKRIEASDG